MFENMVYQDDRLKNYYEILEVPADSTFEKIHEGYVRAKNAYSGDSVALYSIMTKEENEEMLELIETAYSVLSVPSKRREYDRIKGIVSDPSRYEDDGKRKKKEDMTPVAAGAIEGGNGIESLAIKGHALPSGLANNVEGMTLSGPYHPNTVSGLSKDFQIDRNEVEISRLSAFKRFRLEYSKDVQIEQEIENITQFSGAHLRKIREYKNVTLERMSDLTKISKTYLGQMEKDEYEKLPALAYVRGFVYQYAKVLKLNPELVANSYLNYIKELQKKKRDRP